MTYKAIIFDFDGVLVDSVNIKTEAMRQLFAAERQDHVEAIVALHERLAGISRYIKFDMIYAEILCRKLSRKTRDELGKQFSDIVVNAICSCSALPGAIEFLDAYHRQIPLFVVSGTPEPELHHILSRRDMMHYLREAHGSPRSKDAICQDILSRIRISPSETVFVGDALTDLDAAQSVKMHFIGVVGKQLDNPFERDVLVIEDLRELSRALTILGH